MLPYAVDYSCDLHLQSVYADVTFNDCIALCLC